MNIYITGIGVISSIGTNAEENLTSLLNENTGIDNYGENIFSDHKVGKINYSNEELINKFNLHGNHSRTSLLGAIAAKEAFKNHPVNESIKTGLISGTSVGGMDITEKIYLPFLSERKDIQKFNYHISGNTTNYIAKELNLDNIYLNTLSTACSSAANAIMIGGRMIKQGVLDRVIVGGTDSLTEFTFKGFKSLMIFDKEWCKPFDSNRAGLNLGEGAGFIVLESEKSIQISNQKPLARLTGWDSSSDAYHQTASSPEGKGAVLSMSKALKLAKLEPSQINYINAHGTSTPNNDLSESVAIKNVFGTEIPDFSSTKSYTGHTLAASGGIEAVYSVLSINNKVLFPNLNFKTAIEETSLIPLRSIKKNVTINHVLSNSFGFGGNNSTIIISSL